MAADTFDFIPGGGPAWDADLIGPGGNLSRLCKGAKAPPQPPPPPAVPEVDEAGAADLERRRQKNKKGLEQANNGTLLSGAAARQPNGESSYQAGAFQKPAWSVASMQAAGGGGKFSSGGGQM
jgi:hypothetical protein